MGEYEERCGVESVVEKGERIWRCGGDGECTGCRL